MDTDGYGDGMLDRMAARDPFDSAVSAARAGCVADHDVAVQIDEGGAVDIFVNGILLKDSLQESAVGVVEREPELACTVGRHRDDGSGSFGVDEPSQDPGLGRIVEVRAFGTFRHVCQGFVVVMDGGPDGVPDEALRCDVSSDPRG